MNFFFCLFFTFTVYADTFPPRYWNGTLLNRPTHFQGAALHRTLRSANCSSRVLLDLRGLKR